MVVHQVHIADMHAFETEHDAPVSGHADRPLTDKIPLQRVKPESRQIHVRRSGRLVEACQNPLDLGNGSRRNSPSVRLLIEKLEALVAEADYHPTPV